MRRGSRRGPAAPDRDTHAPEPAPQHRRVELACEALLWAGLAVLLGGFVALCWRGEPSEDEWQMLAAAHDMILGKRLYAETWDSHGPMISYGLKWLLGLLDLEHAQFIRHVRLAMTGLLAMTAASFGAIAARSMPFRWQAPGAAALFLMVPWVIRAGWEVRADVPLNALAGVALVLWFEGWRRDSARWFAASGLATGLMLFFSVKIFLFGTGVVGMFAVGALFRPWKRLVACATAFGAAVLPGAVIVGLFLASRGILDAYLHTNFGQNFDRPDPKRWAGVRALWSADPAALVFIVSMMGWCLVRGWRRREAAPMFFATFAAIQVVQFAFLMPRHFSQSLLPVAGPAALAAAWALGDFGRLLARPGVARRAVAVAGAVALSLGVARAMGRMAERRGLDWHLSRHDAYTKLIPPGAAVYSGLGAPLTRPHALPYASLVQTIRERIAAGTIDLDVAAELDRQDVQFTVLDYRVAAMQDGSLQFVLENFVPVRLPYLMAAGMILDAGGERRIRIAGSYHWREDGDRRSRLLVDGKPAPNPVRLEDGPHDFRWSGEEPVVLCVLPASWLGPERRRLAFHEFPTDRFPAETTYLKWWD